MSKVASRPTAVLAFFFFSDGRGFGFVLYLDHANTRDIKSGFQSYELLGQYIGTLLFDFGRENVEVIRDWRVNRWGSILKELIPSEALKLSHKDFREVVLRIEEKIKLLKAPPGASAAA